MTVVRRGGGVAAADNRQLAVFNLAAGLFVVANILDTVILDTVWHAVKGEGRACRRCGGLRHMGSRFVSLGRAPTGGV